jgi:hypothetical protein
LEISAGAKRDSVMQMYMRDWKSRPVNSSLEFVLEFVLLRQTVPRDPGARFSSARRTALNYI